MKQLFAILFLLTGIPALAQQEMPVYDSLSASFQGLKAGYSISGASEKEVGKKGSFSRYKIRFYVTNEGPEAKLFLNRSGGIFNNASASNKVAVFKCRNATGARFTNKEATMQMQPCKIMATVEDKECGSEKINLNRRQVDVGFWIKPGETITVNSIMIVPLNEKPDMAVVFFPENNGTIATANATNGTENTEPGFHRIKNFSAGNYLHVQNGPLNCSGIDFGWWSAQWEIVPAGGSGLYQVRNRWKNNYLSSDNGSLVSDNGQSPAAQWFIEETGSNNTYTIRNAANNLKLSFSNGGLSLVNVLGVPANTQWIFE